MKRTRKLAVFLAVFVGINLFFATASYHLETSTVPSIGLTAENKIIQNDQEEESSKEPKEAVQKDSKQNVEQGNANEDPVNNSNQELEIELNQNADKSKEQENDSAGLEQKGDAVPVNSNKIAYLTFDDGPSKNTIEVLQILKKYDLKATFFVTGQAAKKNCQILQQIVIDGHTIGNHSYSHNYKKIYKSSEAFMAEIEETKSLIYELTGIETEIIRFPGGSYPKADRNYVQLLTERGYVYFDWNVDSKDSTRKDISAKEIKANVVNQVAGKTKVIILMHDGAGKQATVKALPGIIEHLLEQGFQLKQLDKEVAPIQFRLRSSRGGIWRF